jgi:hypothetical protein
MALVKILAPNVCSLFLDQDAGIGHLLFLLGKKVRLLKQEDRRELLFPIEFAW